ncbi:SulP family inorganic anion transporter, partial [bacterium]|nr:SulP family inorganic anion transporter [bacterium]
ALAWRGDLLPGALAALLTLPQAIALAALAGMPFESGLYLSLLPALAATLVGHSPLALSGPNTAASLVLFASATTLAPPGSPDYVQQILATTLFAGLFQVLFAVLRVGNLLLELPASVTRGLIAGTGLLTIGQQMGPLVGVPVNGINLIETLGQAMFFSSPHPGPLAIGVTAILAGFVARAAGRQSYMLLVALVAGWAAAEVTDLISGSANSGLERLGAISMGDRFLSWPTIDPTDTVRFIAALRDGFTVAIVGALQTAIMARIIASRTHGAMYVGKDIAGQAAMNLLAAFTSGFAGATSLNRSLANADAGAKSRAAGIYCVLFLLLGIVLAGPLLARIPLPAVAGVLVLVGWSMLASVRREDFVNRVHLTELLVTLVVTVLIGLLPAVIAGAFLAAYFRALRHRDGSIPHASHHAPGPH